jgi:hypothetical protein
VLTAGRIQPRSAFFVLMAMGLGVRVALALTMPGNPYDTASFHAVAERLTQPEPLHVYSDVNAGLLYLRWPYPPGFFPALVALQHLFGNTGAFSIAMRFPAIAADLGIAALVFHALRPRGERIALGAAALVLLGPSFIANSGAHGQLDAVAALPAVAAVIVWRRGLASRALVAGALIGVGACVKTVPIFFLLALLPTVRSRKELVQLVLACGAVPALMLAPFFLTDPGGVTHALGYRGLPGLGGLSLVGQPSITKAWYTGDPFTLTRLSQLLQDGGTILVALALAVATVLLCRRRTDPFVAAVVIALTLWGYGVNFAFGYALWGLPFLLLAGWVKQVAWAQLALLGPLLMFYGLHWVDDYPTALIYGFYVPVMSVLLGIVLVCHARLLARPASS